MGYGKAKHYSISKEIGGARMIDRHLLFKLTIAKRKIWSFLACLHRFLTTRVAVG
jgi:hypothetical protein